MGSFRHRYLLLFRALLQNCRIPADFRYSEAERRTRTCKISKVNVETLFILQFRVAQQFRVLRSTAELQNSGGFPLFRSGTWIPEFQNK